MAVGTGTAMALSAGASLLGGAMQSDAARDAAGSQIDAANRSNTLQRQIYDRTRGDMELYRQTGDDAVRALRDGDFKRDFTMADFNADPGYNFRMGEAMKAIERSAAARGGLASGATLKALTQRSQDVASQEYQNAYNRFNQDRDRRFGRLSSLAGMGQNAIAQTAGAGQNYANQYGSNLGALGNANAAGRIGQANAWGNALGGTTNNWMSLSMMNRMFPEQKEPKVPDPGMPMAGQSYDDKIYG